MLKRIGKIGAVMAGLTCLVPALLVLFRVAGASWLFGYAEYILIPALALFWGITIYAQQRDKQPEPSLLTKVHSKKQFVIKKGIL